MARTPGIAGTLDIRSAGILQDVVYASNPCAPGIKRWRKMLHIFGANAIREIKDHKLHRKHQRMKNYDGPKDWLALLAATIIIGVILGTIQSYPLFIPSINLIWEIGIVGCVLIGAGSYALFIVLTPISTLFIGCMGHRITSILGILMFFTGIVLLAFEIHWVTVLVAHVALMGFGGSLAYTAAITAVVDRFRKHLLVALILLSFASPIGTAGVSGVVTLIYTYVDANPYRWSQVVLGVLVLLSLLATFSFPARIAPRQRNLTPGRRISHKKVRACIEKAVLRTMPGSRSRSRSLSRSGRRRRSGDCCVPPPPPCARGKKTPPRRPVQPQHYPKLCFCVIDCNVSVLSDFSFLVWACITFFWAMCTFLPHMFLLFFAAMMAVSPDPPSLLVFAFCYASLFGRLISMVSSNHKFIYNRILFQLAMLASGILYLIFSLADTRGWFIVWAGVAGFLEGIISTAIPRVSLQTIPRPWIVSSWVCIVMINGFAMFIGVAFVLSIWITTRSITLGFGALGAGQLLGAFMSFLLPNEEPDIPEPKGKCRKSRKPTVIRTRGRGRRRLRSSSGYSGGFDDGFSLSSYGRGSRRRYDSNSYSYTSAGFGSSGGGGGGSGRSGSSGSAYMRLGLRGMSTSKSYLTDCPICSKAGCIPGCCECVPGGLTSKFKGATGRPEDCAPSSSGTDTEQRIPFSKKPASSSGSSTPTSNN